MTAHNIIEADGSMTLVETIYATAEAAAEAHREFAIDAALEHLGESAHGAIIIRDRDDRSIAVILTETAIHHIRAPHGQQAFTLSSTPAPDVSMTATTLYTG